VFIKLCSAVLDELHARFERHNRMSGYEIVYDFGVE